MRLMETVASKTTEYIEKMPKSMRKKYGQFFTSAETAVFMAELLSPPAGKESLSILDAGAGSGILSVALLNRLDRVQEVKEIHLVCYETDEKIIDLLQGNLEYAAAQLNTRVTFEIRTCNYITSQNTEYNGWIGATSQYEQYDLIVGNPPYMKVPKDAPEALSMPDVCYGAPNMYFLFAAMGAFNLKTNGEMAYIIPRSWTSGAYFKRFRQKFLSECALEHIHLFVSRDKVFDQESVLQETMIIKVRKTTVKPDHITITTSQSNCDFSDVTSFSAPYETVVSGPDQYVYLVTSKEEVEVLQQLNGWEETLPQIGLPMKTGLTVDFRNRDALRNTAEETAVPLFYSQHIKDGKVIFPIGKENEYIVTQQPGLLQDNVNYLFVKRFTAKEERRRLQCGVYLSRLYPDYPLISTQNKINFIGGGQDVSECIIYGLYVLFNSSLYDQYYRILNGSTQVNSTEINTMPVPPISVIEEMGKTLISTHDTSEQNCNMIIGSFLHEKTRPSQATA